MCALTAVEKEVERELDEVPDEEAEEREEMEKEEKRLKKERLVSVFLFGSTCTIRQAVRCQSTVSFTWSFSALNGQRISYHGIIQCSITLYLLVMLLSHKVYNYQTNGVGTLT